MSGHAASHGEDHGDHGHSGGESALGKYLKPFANPFVGGGERAKVLNDSAKATAFNTARQTEAAKEMSPDISTTINAVKSSVSSIISAIKKTVQAPLIATTDIITNAVAIPANIARAIGDKIRAVLRGPLIIADLAMEKTFGKISATAGSVRKSMHDQIAKIDTLNFADLLKSSGGGHGGHAAAAHH